MCPWLTFANVCARSSVSLLAEPQIFLAISSLPHKDSDDLMKYLDNRQPIAVPCQLINIAVQLQHNTKEAGCHIYHPHSSSQYI